MPDDFLTVAEIASTLKVNQQTVRNWIFSTGFGACPALVGLRGRCADSPSVGRDITPERRYPGGGQEPGVRRRAAVDGDCAVGRYAALK
jgi:hypothetical protein